MEPRSLGKQLELSDQGPRSDGTRWREPPGAGHPPRYGARRRRRAPRPSAIDSTPEGPTFEPSQVTAASAHAASSASACARVFGLGQREPAGCVRRDRRGLGCRVVSDADSSCVRANQRRRASLLGERAPARPAPHARGTLSHRPDAKLGGHGARPRMPSSTAPRHRSSGAPRGRAPQGVRRTSPARARGEGSQSRVEVGARRQTGRDRLEVGGEAEQHVRVVGGDRAECGRTGLFSRVPLAEGEQGFDPVRGQHRVCRPRSHG